MQHLDAEIHNDDFQILQLDASGRSFATSLLDIVADIYLVSKCLLHLSSLDDDIGIVVEKFHH